MHKLSKICVDQNSFEEILTTLLLMTDEHNYKLIKKALKELKTSFQIFKLYREIQKVTKFGSTRVVEFDSNYELAQTLTKGLVENGFMIISGAGGGIMEANLLNP